MCADSFKLVNPEGEGHNGMLHGQRRKGRCQHGQFIYLDDVMNKLKARTQGRDETIPDWVALSLQTCFPELAML